MIEYIFLQKETRYLIPPTINTHIDCSKNSKSVFGAFLKQQQGAMKVCCAAFSVTATSAALLRLVYKLHIECLTRDGLEETTTWRA